MKTKSGVKRIEEVKVGDYVWSRDEVTGKQDWKRVKQTFVTRPDHLVTLRYRPVKGQRARRSGASRKGRRSASKEDGSGPGHHAGYVAEASHGKTGRKEGWTPAFALAGAEKDSSLTGTAVHPFWSVDRQAWVDMGALRPGERLSLSDGTEAVVTGMSWEFAKPGERFTTYNFEVEDWHTYFVRHEGGPEWVWVHNSEDVDAGVPGKGCGGSFEKLLPRGVDMLIQANANLTKRGTLSMTIVTRRTLSREGAEKLIAKGTHEFVEMAKDGKRQVLRLVDPTWRGGRIFEEILDHFGRENIKRINGTWIDSPGFSDQFDKFWDLVEGGMSGENAARISFLGKMAERHFNFTKVRFIDPPAHRMVGEVLVEFSGG